MIGNSYSGSRMRTELSCLGRDVGQKPHSSTCRSAALHATDACCPMQAISGLQVQKGFKCLVGAAPDLTLDVPDAAVQIATFIARAVIDDVLPPSFVEELSAGDWHT